MKITIASRWLLLFLLLAGGLIAGLLWAFGIPGISGLPGSRSGFNGERAYADVQTQVAFGPRTPGSEGHAAAVDWMVEQLTQAGWDAQVLEAQIEGQTVRNIQADRGDLSEEKRLILVGAHYDSRFYADNDPDPANHRQPVPGANDGASGVAVLLELARTLPEDLPVSIRLVFFDAEDQGNIAGWDWILGSRAYVRDMQERPDAMVLIDMIGDADLNVPQERSSTPELVAQIWGVAADLGYEAYFPNQVKYNILDDHWPFLEAGIPAADLIDFDYAYWHTVEDTPDKVSPLSLQIIGEVLTAWILAGAPADAAGP